jgi:hypothetical protein
MLVYVRTGAIVVFLVIVATLSIGLIFKRFRARADVVMIAVVVAFLPATLVPILIAPVRDLFAPLCAPDAIVATTTDDGDDEGHSVECRAPDGDTYGSFAIWTASFDAFFVASAIGTFVVLRARRRTRERET